MIGCEGEVVRGEGVWGGGEGEGKWEGGKVKGILGWDVWEVSRRLGEVKMRGDADRCREYERWCKEEVNGR